MRIFFKNFRNNFYNRVIGNAYVFTYCVYESEIFFSKNNFMVYFSTFEQKFYSFNLIVIYRTRAQPCFILPTSKKLSTLIKYI